MTLAQRLHDGAPRLEESPVEGRMTTHSTASVLPQMVHIAVGDCDRAMRFFGALFDWEAERVEWDGHVRQYLLNTSGPQPVLTDEPNAPAVRLGFTVADVGIATETITTAGGVVQQTGLSDDGRGWALADDGQGTALVVWKPSDDHAHHARSKPARAELEYLWVMVPDIARAREFYAALVGWDVEANADGRYHHVRDERGRIAATIVESGDPAGVKLFFAVDDLERTTAAVRDLGGEANAAYDLGPNCAADCTDDQGTAFSLLAHESH
jgi:predicted enzyme related to lactoylglutathione lyase